MPLWIALLLVLPQVAAAQDYPDLTKGDLIRVVPLSGEIQVGTFQLASPEGLTLKPERYPPRTFSHEEIHTVQVPDGKDRLTTALIGATIGVVAGALFGGLDYCGDDCDDPDSVDGGEQLLATTGAALGVVRGALVFGVAGAALGGLVFPNDRWRDVERRPRP
jgi:hypothetical protein